LFLRSCERCQPCSRCNKRRGKRSACDHVLSHRDRRWAQGGDPSSCLPRSSCHPGCVWFGFRLVKKPSAWAAHLHADHPRLWACEAGAEGGGLQPPASLDSSLQGNYTFWMEEVLPRPQRETGLRSGLETRPAHPGPSRGWEWETGGRCVVGGCVSFLMPTGTCPGRAERLRGQVAVLCIWDAW
jgi:hypothetical protein